MASVTDELIMAYADGELDELRARRVRNAMRTDEAMQQKHEIFLGTRVVLARSFSPVLDEPVPERLTSAVRAKD